MRTATATNTATANCRTKRKQMLKTIYLRTYKQTHLWVCKRKMSILLMADGMLPAGCQTGWGRSILFCVLSFHHSLWVFRYFSWIFPFTCCSCCEPLAGSAPCTGAFVRIRLYVCHSLRYSFLFWVMGTNDKWRRIRQCQNQTVTKQLSMYAKSAEHCSIGMYRLLLLLSLSFLLLFSNHVA